MTSPAPNPFDPTSLRLNKGFGGTAGVKKLLTRVPVRKPGKQEWFRVLADPSYRMDLGVIQFEEDDSTYAVTHDLQADLIDLNRTRNAPSLLRLDVVESDAPRVVGWIPCVIGSGVRFSTEGLETYRIGDWDPLIYDALLLAAAVEYCDRALARKEFDWHRYFELRLPVHDPDRWNEPALKRALVAALELLTGDSWTIDFVARQTPVEAPRQNTLGLPNNVAAVLPYSDGLDSRAVGGLITEQLRGGLVRIRLGPVGSKRKREIQPFAKIPYEVVVEGGTKESSGRSRGFKFAMVASVGAYLAHAPRVSSTRKIQYSH